MAHPEELTVSLPDDMQVEEKVFNYFIEAVEEYYRLAQGVMKRRFLKKVFEKIEKEFVMFI